MWTIYFIIDLRTREAGKRQRNERKGTRVSCARGSINHTACARLFPLRGLTRHTHTRLAAEIFRRSILATLMQQSRMYFLFFFLLCLCSYFFFYFTLLLTLLSFISSNQFNSVPVPGW